MSLINLLVRLIISESFFIASKVTAETLIIDKYPPPVLEAGELFSFGGSLTDVSDTVIDISTKIVDDETYRFITTQICQVVLTDCKPLNDSQLNEEYCQCTLETQYGSANRFLFSVQKKAVYDPVHLDNIPMRIETNRFWDTGTIWYPSVKDPIYTTIEVDGCLFSDKTGDIPFLGNNTVMTTTEEQLDVTFCIKNLYVGTKVTVNEFILAYPTSDYCVTQTHDSTLSTLDSDGVINFSYIEESALRRRGEFVFNLVGCSQNAICNSESCETCLNETCTCYNFPYHDCGTPNLTIIITTPTTTTTTTTTTTITTPTPITTLSPPSTSEEPEPIASNTNPALSSLEEPETMASDNVAQGISLSDDLTDIIVVNNPSSTNEESLSPASTNEESLSPASTNEESLSPANTNEESLSPANTNEESLSPASTNEESLYPSTTNEDEDEDSGLSTSWIIGIVFMGIAALSVFFVIMFILSRKRNK